MSKMNPQSFGFPPECGQGLQCEINPDGLLFTLKNTEVILKDMRYHKTRLAFTQTSSLHGQESFGEPQREELRHKVKNINKSTFIFQNSCTFKCTRKI